MRLVIIRHYYFTCDKDRDQFMFLLNKYGYNFKTLTELYGCSRTYMCSIYQGRKPVHRDMLNFFYQIFNYDPVIYDLFNFEVL